MRLAILGLGNMGRAFATRALATGHDVTVWNRSPGRAGELVDAGATEAATVADAVAGAEAVLTIVADDAAVRSIALGPDGAFAALAGGAVFANASTVSPETARALAEAGPAGRVLDTPVMGSPAAIESGHGRFLVGGPADAVAVLDPLLDDLGAEHVHCGPSGAGATMKVASNLLLVTTITALAEAVVIARGQGVEDDLLRRVFGDSLVTSAAMRLRLDQILDERHPGWFPPALGRKDVRLAGELAARAGARPGVGAATDELLTRVIDGGGDWADIAAVIEGYR